MNPKLISYIDDNEPIPIEECRAHLEAARYGNSDDSPEDELNDVMILGWLGAAREHCEAFTGLALTRRVVELALDAFPTACTVGRNWIELPMGPVQEILSVTTAEAGSDSDQTDYAMPETDYRLDDFVRPARLYPVSSWPAVTGGGNAIRVRYVTGYGLELDSDDEVIGGVALPKSIRAAMLLVLGHLYAHREESTEKALASIPLGAEALLRPHRVLLGMA